jgi:curved DNA-binding protein CbpA/DNA-binding response OmpR family regulator
VPQKVLIVEDEASASRLVAALCAEAGLAVLETGSGNEAKAALERTAAAGEPFAAVVLDLVLEDLDGFRVGQFLRGQPWGANTPLIVISGVYKQPNPELMRELRPLAYFAKPFEPAQVRDALVRACNVRGVATTVEGDLTRKPAAALFVDLLRQKASGVLTLTTGSAVRKIHFQQGQVRFAQSNVLAESAGSAQVASGIIKQASFDRAVAMSKQNKVPLHEALAHSRVMSPEQLKAVVRQQTMDVSLNALPMDSGTYRFEPQAQGLVDSVPDTRMSPVSLIVDAARRLGAPADSKKWLEARRDSTLARSPELDRDLFAVRQAWPGESVTAFATGGRGVQEALARVKEAELPLLHWLCVSGLVQLAGGQTAQPSPVAGNRALSELDRGKTFDAREQAARRTLVESRERFREANHYQVLGVQRGADAEAIKAAYFEAAKKFHSDSFSGMELGSAGPLAEELFGRVGEAYGVVTDPEKRAEYDVYLDRKAKGLPTDVGAVLRAEDVFQRGEKLFKSGKWEEAEAAFREAVSLNGAEAEFHAYLGMAMFRKRGDADGAVSFVERALEMDPRLKSGTLFRAQICEAQGDLEKAKSILRRAVEQDPGFEEAREELGRLRRGPPAPEKKGLLTRLLKK